MRFLVLLCLLSGCPGEFHPDLMGWTPSEGTGLETDTSGGETGTETGGMGDGMQPNAGLYSPCTSQDDCLMDSVDLTLCMGTMEDGETLPDNGWMETPPGQPAFCTFWADPAENPFFECEPHPGGDVTAELGWGQNSYGQKFCALACEGGKSCPAGMNCIHVYSETTVYDSYICL